MPFLSRSFWELSNLTRRPCRCQIIIITFSLFLELLSIPTNHLQDAKCLNFLHFNLRHSLTIIPRYLAIRFTLQRLFRLLEEATF
jgi:hypothetical protein